jgi:O-antigen ligase
MIWKHCGRLCDGQMPEQDAGSPGRGPTSRLRQFFVAEAICLVGAGVAAWQGESRVSLVFLIAPLQLGVLALLFKSDFMLLAYFVALLPLTALELVPYAYVHYVMYGVVLGLTAFLRWTAFLDGRRGSTASGLSTWYRAPLILLGVCVWLAYLNARAQGWLSPYVWVYSVLAIQVLVFAWLVATVPRSMGQLRQIIYIASAGYAVMCVAFPFVSSQVGLGSAGKTFAVSGAFVNLNSVAAHAAVFALVAFGASRDARKTFGRVLLLVISFLLVLVLVYTKSRGAWLGFGLAFVYMIARTRSYWLILPAAVVLGVLLTSSVLQGALVSRVEATSSDDPSLLGRLLLWKYALVVFKANWALGVGMENFRYVKHFFGYPFSLASSVRYNSHNLFLEFLADLGVVGTGCFLWLVGGAFVRVDRIVRRSASSEHAWLAVGLNAGLIAFLAHGLVDSVTWQSGAFMLLGFLIGMCLCIQRVARSPVSGLDSVPLSGPRGQGTGVPVDRLGGPFPREQA